MVINMRELVQYLLDNPGALVDFAYTVIEFHGTDAADRIATVLEDAEEALYDDECSEDDEPDCSDGDALASAGFGTDEDYSGYPGD